MSRRRVGAGCGVIVLGVLAVLYFTGSLDSTLYKAGLNYTACARKSAGVIYCGTALTAYDRRAAERQRREVAERRTAAERRATEQNTAKEAEQKAATERIEGEQALRAERLCGLLREYLHASPGEQTRILELMAQIAPTIASRNMFGRPTGFNVPALKLQLTGSSCKGAE